MTNAGWYPDPDGKGGQRYFDGTNWGPSMPPAATSTQMEPPKQPGNGPKIFAVVCVLFFGLLVVGKCGGSDDKDSDSKSSASSSTTTRPLTTRPATAAPPTPTGPEKPEATFTTSEGPNGQQVTAAFAIGDNFTEGMIKSGARYKTIEILEYADVAYPNAASVTVQGSFPMQDAYGNTSTSVVINITYLRSTLDKINFSGIDKDNIWELRDSGTVAPAFQP